MIEMKTFVALELRGAAWKTSSQPFGFLRIAYDYESVLKALRWGLRAAGLMGEREGVACMSRALCGSFDVIDSLLACYLCDKL